MTLLRMFKFLMKIMHTEQTAINKYKHKLSFFGTVLPVRTEFMLCFLAKQFIKHNRNLAVLLSLVSILLRVLVKLGLNLQPYFQSSFFYIIRRSRRREVLGMRLITLYLDSCPRVDPCRNYQLFHTRAGYDCP